MEKYLINPNQRIATISKDIYGHFSEHWVAAFMTAFL